MNLKLAKIRTRVGDQGEPILSDEELAWRLHQELNTGSPRMRRTRGEAKGGQEDKTGAKTEKRDKKDKVEGQKDKALDSRDGGRAGKRTDGGREGEGRGGKKGASDKALVEKGVKPKSNSKERRQEALPRRSPRALETVESGLADATEKSRDGKYGKDAGAEAKGRGRGGRQTRNGHKDGIKKEVEDVEAAKEESRDSKDDETKGQPLPQKKGRSRKGKPSVASDGAMQESGPSSSGKKRGRSMSKGGAKKPAPKIPKLPMVKEGEHWYRTRVLKETEKRIHVEFAGYEHTMPATWLPKYSERVWLGSYKGKDWRYSGDGAWVPKNGINNKIVTMEDYDVPEGAIDMGYDEKQDRGRKKGGSGGGTRFGSQDARENSPEDDSDGENGGYGDNWVDEDNSYDAKNAGANEDLVKPADKDVETISSSGDRGSRPSKKKAAKSGSGRKGASANAGNSDIDAKTNAHGGGSRKSGKSRKRGVSSEAVSKKNSEEDSGGAGGSGGGGDGGDGGGQKRHRPKRNTKKTALFNNADFSMEVEADSADGHNGNNLMESEATYQSSRRNLALNMNTLDDEEQEALAALAEMPASPACGFTGRCSEAVIEDTREALLEAYTNGNGHTKGYGQAGYADSNGPYAHHHLGHHGKLSKTSTGSGSKRQWKRSFRSEPNMHRPSHTAESIMVAGRVFGGLMHAISARIGNGIHRSVSLPAQADGLAPAAAPTGMHASGGHFQADGLGLSPRAWTPHVWTSGVNPADSEPAIVQVPLSLIQKALVSPRYTQSDTNQARNPPVPLFY